MHSFHPPKFARAAVASLALAAFSIVPAAQAATMVAWGGDYVSAYTGFTAGTPSSGPGWATYSYSESTLISPAGPKFYGAFSVVNGSGTGSADFAKSIERFGIQNNAAADSIRFGVEATATSGIVTMQGLVFFKKEDFLNGEAGGTVSFSSGDSLSMQISGHVGSGGQVRMAVYALVGGEWGWYLSETRQTSTGALTIADPGAANWGLYQVDGNTSPLNAAPTTYNVSGVSFSDIRAFGSYFTNQTTAVAGNRAALFVTGYSVNATAVPEPKVAVLSIGGLVLLAGRGIWKKQQLPR